MYIFRSPFLSYTLIRLGFPFFVSITRSFEPFTSSDKRSSILDLPLVIRSALKRSAKSLTKLLVLLDGLLDVVINSFIYFLKLLYRYYCPKSNHSPHFAKGIICCACKLSATFPTSPNAYFYPVYAALLFTTRTNLRAFVGTPYLSIPLPKC